MARKHQVKDKSKAPSPGASTPEEWTAEGFLDEFVSVNSDMLDRRFLFILGAGASRSSGIPDGGEIAHRWVEEMRRQAVGEAGPPVEEWATEETLGIPGFRFDRTAEFYPQLYDRRFRGDPERGYAYLERVMEKAKPEIGYSVLAQVLARTRHKIVITTNFDNLVADALATYADTYPLVCGHESLAGFARPMLQRPLIAKIHRDLLLAPRNAEEETSRLDEQWERVLQRLLEEYTPIVVGYGGNDGSLMGFLQALPPGQLLGGVYWCYWEPGGRPVDRICDLVAKHDGRLVPILGFDELMLQLSERLQWSSLAEAMTKKQDEQLRQYRKSFEEFSARVKEKSRGKDEGVLRALRGTVARERTWWHWELRAEEEQDLDRREATYREGLQQFPNSAELMNNLAALLSQMGKGPDEAECLYKRALELDPSDANAPGNYANFLEVVRKDYDGAERLYKRALELDPNHANNTGNYANFLETVRKDYDGAERLYKRALELDPSDANAPGNYANFLGTVRKDYDGAERLYKRVLELDPNNANNAGNYASFLGTVRKDYDGAERLYKRALELDPNHANNAGNYASFLGTVRKDYDGAERLYKRALELDPDDAYSTGSYANLLETVRKDYDGAERLYKRALELDPSDANNAGNYGGFLLARHRTDEALAQVKRAWSLNRGAADQLSGELLVYWCLLATIKRSSSRPGLARAHALLAAGFERSPSDFGAVLSATKESVAPEAFSLYSSLAEAILDERKLEDLRLFPEWQEVTPIPLTEPWSLDLD